MKLIGRKIVFFFLTHQFTHVLWMLERKGPSHLIETVLLSTHNMFWLRNKNNINYTLLTAPIAQLVVSAFGAGGRGLESWPHHTKV